MYYFDEIINRLKNELNITSDKELYELMEEKQGTFTNWRARNKIPYEQITTLCVSKNINLNYILGNKEKDIKDINYKEELLKTIEKLKNEDIQYLYHVAKSKELEKK